tara:strand:- start:194 stop:1066 length:873 start_codon:yes stop_codon:yes gene_type:complete
MVTLIDKNDNNKIIIGAAQFGMDYGIANKNGRVKDEEIKSILDLAYNQGIKTIDTAKIYGESEKALGQYLKNTHGKWDVITKIKNIDSNIFQQLQDSKEKLTINPYALLAHTSEIFTNKKFQSVANKAKVKRIINKVGVSIYDGKDINQLLELMPDIIQLPMNILDTRLYRSGIISKLFDRGIEIHVRSVFLQGLFYLSDSELKRRFKDVWPQIYKLKSISSKEGLTIAELSLIWVASLKEVSKIIIGVDNLNHLKDHLKTLSKTVDISTYEEALSICYDNEKILNPSLW